MLVLAGGNISSPLALPDTIPIHSEYALQMLEGQQKVRKEVARISCLLCLISNIYLALSHSYWNCRMYNPDDYQIVQEMAREPVNHLVHSESIQTEEGTLFPDYMMKP